jgi:hypothetical protein
LANFKKQFDSLSKLYCCKYVPLLLNCLYANKSCSSQLDPVLKAGSVKVSCQPLFKKQKTQLPACKSYSVKFRLLLTFGSNANGKCRMIAKVGVKAQSCIIVGNGGCIAHCGHIRRCDAIFHCYMLSTKKCGSVRPHAHTPQVCALSNLLVLGGKPTTVSTHTYQALATVQLGLPASSQCLMRPSWLPEQKAGCRSCTQRRKLPPLRGLSLGVQ